MKRVAVLGFFPLLLLACTPTPSSPQQNTNVAPAESDGASPSQIEPAGNPEGEVAKNLPPVIHTDTLPDAVEDAAYNMAIDVSDPENDPVVLALVTGPDGLQVTSGNALAWTPTQAAVGAQVVQLRATDAEGNASNKSFSLTVQNTNDAPTLQVPEVIIVDETETVTIDPQVSDEDGDPLAVAYAGWMQEATKKTTYTDSGTHTVAVSVSDGQSSTTATVKIIVNNVNQSPTIAGVQDMTVHEGEEVVLTPTATDADDNPVTITVSGWMTTLTKKTTFDDAGSYLVTITATDGNTTTTKTMQVTVLNVNRPPQFLPEQIKNLTVDEAEIFSIPLLATDPDGDALIFAQYPENPALLTATIEGAIFSGSTKLNAAEFFSDSAWSPTLDFVAYDTGTPPLQVTLTVTLTVADRWEDPQFILAAPCCDPVVSNGTVFYCKKVKTGTDVFKFNDGVHTMLSSEAPSSGGCVISSENSAIWTESVEGEIHLLLHVGGNQTGVIATGQIGADAISGTKVLWHQKLAQSFELMLKDGAITQLTNDEFSDHSSTINGNRFAWVKQHSTVSVKNYLDFEIHHFDGQQMLQLTDDKFEDVDPKMGPSILTWVCHGTGTIVDREICVYANGKVVQLTDDTVRDDAPVVSETDEIYWYKRGPQGGIYRYADGQITSITNVGEHDINPQVAKGLVVWRRSYIPPQNPSDAVWWIMAAKGEKRYILSTDGFGDPRTDGAIVVWKTGDIAMTRMK